MLAIPPFWASSKKALLRANTKPPVELVVADLECKRSEIRNREDKSEKTEKGIIRQSRIEENAEIK